MSGETSVSGEAQANQRTARDNHSEPDRRIRILIADDQALLRGSLRLLMQREPDLEVVGEAADGREAIDLAAATRPDVVLMDIRMPHVDGVEATRRILAAAPPDAAPRILALSMFDLDELVFAALEAGASGFVLKDVPPVDLLDAVRRTARGDALLASSITRRLIAHVVGRERRDAEPLAELTPRETEVLALVGAGCTNDEIAQRLHIARATVKTHIARLLAKLEARDRVQLVIVAFRRGLVR